MKGGKQTYKAMDTALIQEYQSEAFRIEEDAVHSSKGHYNAADGWRKAHFWIGVPNAIIAAVAGISAFQGSELWAGSLAVAVAAIAATNTFLNPGDRASTHKACAGEYLALRNKCRMFRNIVLKLTITDPEIEARFQDLATKRDDLNSSSPQIPEWAFQKAKKGIDAGEATHKH